MKLLADLARAEMEARLCRPLRGDTTVFDDAIRTLQQLRERIAVRIEALKREQENAQP